MKYLIVRLSFSGDVHFGDGIIESSVSALPADVLFSAICCELAESGREERIGELVSAVRSGSLRLSDTFPYCGEKLYLPRPYLQVKAGSDDGDSVKKKAFRKLRYIPAEQYGAFLEGRFTFEDCQKALEEAAGMSGFALYSQVSVRGELPEPYSVGKVQFGTDCGLWCIIAAADDAMMDEMKELFCQLGLSGIGGKRSSGCGGFRPVFRELPAQLEKRLRSEEGAAVSLSVCLPKEEELEKAMEEASYSVIKRSGFVYSGSYSATPRKKNDLFVFSAGSCFRERFTGDVYDVSAGGAHPVYRYAAPLFMSIGGEL